MCYGLSPKSRTIRNGLGRFSVPFICIAWWTLEGIPTWTAACRSLLSLLYCLHFHARPCCRLTYEHETGFGSVYGTATGSCFVTPPPLITFIFKNAFCALFAWFWFATLYSRTTHISSKARGGCCRFLLPSATKWRASGWQRP